MLQHDSLEAGPTLRLKILVSVVRFRPGPPRTSFTQRPLMQVGVVVSGIRSPCVRSISGSLLRRTTDQIVQLSEGITPIGA
jgi:hypothetical protein